MSPSPLVFTTQGWGCLVIAPPVAPPWSPPIPMASLEPKGDMNHSSYRQRSQPGNTPLTGADDQHAACFERATGHAAGGGRSRLVLPASRHRRRQRSESPAPAHAHHRTQPPGRSMSAHRAMGICAGIPGPCGGGSASAAAGGSAGVPYPGSECLWRRGPGERRTCDQSLESNCSAFAVYSRTRRRRSALAMTDTELNVIAALAMIGVSSSPKTGYRTPAAIGTPSAL